MPADSFKQADEVKVDLQPVGLKKIWVLFQTNSPIWPDDSPIQLRGMFSSRENAEKYVEFWKIQNFGEEVYLHMHDYLLDGALNGIERNNDEN